MRSDAKALKIYVQLKENITNKEKQNKKKVLAYSNVKVEYLKLMIANDYFGTFDETFKSPSKDVIKEGRARYIKIYFNGKELNDDQIISESGIIDRSSIEYEIHKEVKIPKTRIICRARNVQFNLILEDYVPKISTLRNDIEKLLGLTYSSLKIKYVKDKRKDDKVYYTPESDEQSIEFNDLYIDFDHDVSLDSIRWDPRTREGFFNGQKISRIKLIKSQGEGSSKDGVKDETISTSDTIIPTTNPNKLSLKKYLQNLTYREQCVGASGAIAGFIIGLGLLYMKLNHKNTHFYTDSTTTMQISTGVTSSIICMTLIIGCTAICGALSLTAYNNYNNERGR